MEYSVVIKDETLSGEILNQIVLKLKDEITTIEEIIKARVREEVNIYNKKATGDYYGLVQPKESEKILNKYRLSKAKPIDPDEQVQTALKAFQNNGFFILIDDKQYDELQTEVLLESTTSVSFIKLTPLIGG